MYNILLIYYNMDNIFELCKTGDLDGLIQLEKNNKLKRDNRGTIKSFEYIITK